MGCGAGEGAVRTAGGAGRHDLGRGGGGADVPGSSSPKSIAASWSSKRMSSSRSI